MNTASLLRRARASTRTPDLQPLPPRGRLLLADDLASLRESLRRLLAREGYQVVGVDRAEAVLEAVAREPFDALLLDLSMPGLGGWEALRRLADAHPELPVIVITAHSNQRAWVEPLGAMALLEKPLDIPQLLAVVNEAVGRRHACESLGARPRRFTHTPAQESVASAHGRGINE